MVATPLRLAEALRFKGYTIEPVEIAASTIELEEGALVVPAMLGFGLEWRREWEATDSDSLFLTRLPVFAEAYRPVMLSTILGHFGQRRIGYNTPDEFAFAVLRWGNLHLGPGSILNRRYASAVVDLPLTTIDTAMNGTSAENTTGTSDTNDSSTTNDNSTANNTASSNDSSTSTSKGRNAESDFPQGMIAGNRDYATSATDQLADSTQAGTGATTAEQIRAATIAASGSSTGTTTGSRNGSEQRTETGRSGMTVMELLAEQRDSYINAEEEFKAAFESLFLGVLDLGEREGSGPPFTPNNW